MKTKYFKSYEEAWEFVHKLATEGYDYDKQAEACEAFRLMCLAAEHADYINKFDDLTKGDEDE